MKNTRVGAASAAWFVTIAVTGAALAGCSTGAQEAESTEATATATVDAVEATATATAGATATADAVADVSMGLDAYVAAEQATIPTLMETFAGTYEEMTVEAEGESTVRYTYTYAEVVDAEVYAAALESQTDSLQDSCDTMILPAMESYGVSDPAVVYTFLNNDGSLIWEQTFTYS